MYMHRHEQKEREREREREREADREKARDGENETGCLNETRNCCVMHYDNSVRPTSTSKDEC